MRSSIEIYNIRTRQMRVVWQTPELFEAPNWSPDGTYLLLNSEGFLYRLPLSGDPSPQKVDTGFATICNNDHGISPDGSMYALSDKVEFGKSTIYLLPSSGGALRLMTKNLPSYWHGWSPDGKQFAYCGIRDQVFDIYSMEIETGIETRLTHGEGRNDGGLFCRRAVDLFQLQPHRPDADLARAHRWFGGRARDGQRLWRLVSAPVTEGDKVVFISYDGDVFDHPRDLDVRVRLMDPDGGNVETLFDLFGGQGTMNSPNWSPDGDEFAYVRYFLSDKLAGVFVSVTTPA